eukprot:TRINITY_DN25827_c0_g1_i1.p1 TRINITY_DN25827_c0_g1~~TRINITY_DN25827_c0_g1_i1.p1  ORF type:complete len:380 (+),score=188.46 TRINITY_DN25827_c0_g1_i1:151-1290(+)
MTDIQETVSATYKKLLMDSSYSDLSLIVGRDKVYSHRCIVSIRCEEILPLPVQDAKKKKIKDKGSVTLKDGVPNQAILVKVLEYLYTGKVNFPKMDPPAILQLRKAGTHYKLDRLSWLCESYFMETMSMENIFHVLKAAADTKEEMIKDFCLKYALNHYNDFVTNKDGLRVLGIDLFQEVVASQAHQPKFDAVELRAEPPCTLLADLERLYSLMPYADTKVSVDGDVINCHRSILAAASEKLGNLVSSGSNVEIKNLSAPAFRAVLKFLYYGDTDIPTLPACELVPWARSNDLNELMKVCEDKIRGDVQTDTVLGILEVAYMAEVAHKSDLVEELKNKAFPFILAHLKEIDLGPLKGMQPVIAQDILFKIQDYRKKEKR